MADPLGILFLVSVLGFLLLIVVSMWVVFAKAGQPGWAAFVPFYNVYVLTCKIAGKDVGWFVLEFIPIVNLYTSLLVMMAVARKFGKSDLFGVGLWLFGFVFFPLLAFGGAKYQDGSEWVEDDWNRSRGRDDSPWASGAGGRKRREVDNDW